MTKFTSVWIWYNCHEAISMKESLANDYDDAIGWTSIVAQPPFDHFYRWNVAVLRVVWFFCTPHNSRIVCWRVGHVEMSCNNQRVELCLSSLKYASHRALFLTSPIPKRLNDGRNKVVRRLLKLVIPCVCYLGIQHWCVCVLQESPSLIAASSADACVLEESRGQ